ncbi:MAG TPA: hypothetical protein VFQ91_16700 [Bryobacteraceae bacterium]|nr:hypothetical protein [Bryobacteraceae bacterium]
MPNAEGEKQFSVPCPCCGAELRIDPQTRSVLYHEPAAKAAPITDLAAEVQKLRRSESEREQVFQRSLEAERQRGRSMEQKFDDLLKRAQQTPGGKPIKDIDL